MNTIQLANGYFPKTVVRWSLGDPPGRIAPGEGVVAFTATGLSRALAHGVFALGFHEAMRSADLPRAAQVDVFLPAYRGKAFVSVLNWLVVRHLAAEDAEVSWFLTKNQGANSFPALLTRLGWQDVRRSRESKLYRIAGRPPAETSPPQPRVFTERLGDSTLNFAADYGVFSPTRVDDGTADLLREALRQPHVPVVADIGVGYGPVALGVVSNGLADRAVATDVDCVALWLAGSNAEANGVQLELFCTEDPEQVENTALTVCNIPTHIDAASSTIFMRALARRAIDGQRLLAVVHASLAGRYTRHLADAGLSARQHPGESHVVLEVSD